MGSSEPLIGALFWSQRDKLFEPARQDRQPKRPAQDILLAVTRARAPVTPRQLAAVIGVATGVSYLLTRTRDFGGDDTIYAMAVDAWLQHGLLERAFLHPHHPLYNPLVGLVAWIWRSLSGQVLVLDAGAAVSAVAAALTVAGLVLVLVHAGINHRVSVLTACIVATAGSFWRFATMMEVYTLAAAGTLLWLTVLARPRPRAHWLGLGLAAAWLSHLILGLLVLPTAWCLRRRPRTLVITLLYGVVAPGLVLVVAQALAQGISQVSDLPGLFVSSSLGSWLHMPRAGALPEALRGLMLWRWYEQVPVYPPVINAGLSGLGRLALLLLAPLVVLGCAIAIRQRRPIGIAAVTGLLVLLPYWLMWDIGLAQHMVPAIALLAVLLALGADALPNRLGGIVLTGALVCLVIANGVGSAVPQTQAYLSKMLLMADFVRDVVPEQGQVLAVGVDPKVRLSLPYLSSRHVEDLTLLVHAARSQELSPEAALAYWLSRVADDRPTWALAELLDPATLHWIEQLGLTRDAWQHALSQLAYGPPRTMPADGVVLTKPITLIPIRRLAH